MGRICGVLRRAIDFVSPSLPWTPSSPSPHHPPIPLLTTRYHLLDIYRPPFGRRRKFLPDMLYLPAYLPEHIPEVIYLPPSWDFLARMPFSHLPADGLDPLLSPLPIFGGGGDEPRSPHLHHLFSGVGVFSEIEEILLHFLRARSLQIEKSEDLTPQATAAIFSYRVRFAFLYSLNADHVNMGHISEQSNVFLRQLLTGHVPFTLTCYRDVRASDQRGGTSVGQRIVIFQVSRVRTKYTSGTIATVRFFDMDLGTIERIFNLMGLVEYYFYIGGKKFAVTRDDGVYNVYNDSGIKFASITREVIVEDIIYTISFFHSLTLYEKVMIVCLTPIIDIDQHSAIDWENVVQLLMDFLI